MTTKIEQLVSAIEGHGYAVTSEPIEGQEAEYTEFLRTALHKIENVVQVQKEMYGYRGLSKRALYSLHKSLPEPAWSIEVK